MSQISPFHTFIRGLIPLLVIAFICLRYYHYWRRLAVPRDPFWRAPSLLEMCEPGMMEAPLGTVWYLSSDHLLSLTEHIGLLIRRGNVFLQGIRDSRLSVEA